MEKDDFVSEKNDKDLVLELLMFSTSPLLYMTEDIQIHFKFYRRRADKINSIAIAWDVFDVCHKERTLDAIHIPRVLEMLIADGKKTRKLILEQFNFILKFFYTDYDCYNLRNKLVKKN